MIWELKLFSLCGVMFDAMMWFFNPACRRCVHTVYSVGEKNATKILPELLFDYLYIMDLINARKNQHVKIAKTFTTISCFWP